MKAGSSAGEWDDWQRWLNTQIALELDRDLLVAHQGLNRFLIEEKRLSECLEGLRERLGVEYLIQVCDDFAEQLEPEERKLSFVLRTADFVSQFDVGGYHWWLRAVELGSEYTDALEGFARDPLGLGPKELAGYGPT